MSEAKKYGWTGQGLRINLTTGEITKVPTQKDWIGGTALGYKIFWDEVPPKTQAFDEANKIVIAPGPLTGTGARLLRQNLRYHHVSDHLSDP